jgi:hypothetical protein
VRPRVSRINGAAVPPVNVRQFFSEFDGLKVSPLTVVDNAVLPTFHVSEFQREFDMNVSQTFVACGLIEHRPVGESTETFELVVTVRVELLEVPKVARLPQR